MSNAPIGVFDSGVGGLTILQAIREHLPNENLLYVADSAYAPYGRLPKEILHKRCMHIARFFAEQGAKAMVIACNTATAVMAEWLRNEFDIPIIAMEPAIKPAALATRTGKIGVFATENTLKSDRYQKLLVEYARDKKVFESSCEGFVEQVESGNLNSVEAFQLVEKYLQPMIDEHIDVLVLGCTHYPFLAPLMRKISSQQVAGNQELQIIHTADAVSLQLTRVLAEHDLLNFKDQEYVRYFTSGDAKRSSTIFSQLLLENISVSELPAIQKK
ncbi:glutamate racemase [Kangiella aquimarina]|uniref:Glutamate racemase n=1 Tax=Kangiella aquimarina TaxID=261965 RepID=A0ABZ0X4Q1_9GAMM|nr:glutamate racemase [Kangiella aquimarina]WQG85500.1 glutamate racemase [Kangiella aquimarina]